ncbi:MAG: hypothetical protein IAE82_19830 [Opitutaceae bacterium]|nr:hypothetical protein [Opitutaceae bacterium]
MNAPHAYIILGSSGSGRRELLADLIANGLDEPARPVLLVASGETPTPEGAVQRLGVVSQLVQGSWQTEEGRVVVAPDALPEGATHVFILTHGRANPVDQIEALHAWLPSAGLELARIITVVNCQLASAHAELARWYDACVHFSDVVLLGRRDGVANKWVSDFAARYRKQHFPCLIEVVKKGDLENPALILEPQARRMSMLFDAEDTWAVGTDADTVVEDDADDDEDADKPSADDIDDPDLIGEVDPYLERLAGSGRRAKEIPDIAKFVP